MLATFAVGSQPYKIYSRYMIRKDRILLDR
jgi:hypothetical protein